MLTIRDIAGKCNLSVATVSRALDPAKKHLVHPETQALIEKIVRQNHYIPNRSARALSKHRSDTIGMVTPFSTDVIKSPYFEGLLSGIIEGIRPLSYDLKWIMIRNEEVERWNLNELLCHHSVDGVLFLSWRIFPKLVKEIEHHARLPLVLINDYTPQVRSSIVYSDNAVGVERLGAYFLSQGYKRIGMLRGPEYISHDARERFLGFKSFMKKSGLKLNQNAWRMCQRFAQDDGYQAMLAWIKEGDLPRAIFCANDDLAKGAMRALKESGIKIPDQVAIAGFDGSEQNENLNPSLTSIRQPLEAMGQAAMAILEKLITKKVKGATQLKFAPELVIGKSA